MTPAPCAPPARPHSSDQLDGPTLPYVLGFRTPSAFLHPAAALRSSSCTSKATQSHPERASPVSSISGSPPTVDDMMRGVPWPDAVSTVVNRAVAVAVAVPCIATAVPIIACPALVVTPSTRSSLVVPFLVQATAFLEPAVSSVVVEAVIKSFIVFVGWDSSMVADLKGVPPPPRSPPFECAALPPLLVRAIFDRATTYVALLLSGSSRDLMITVRSPTCG